MKITITYRLHKAVFAIFFLLLLTSGIVSSQGIIRLQSCSDSLITHQADSIKSVYAKDGFLIVKEASILMESEYESPVILPLNEGSLYQIIFIGDISSRLYEVRMFDWNEKMVFYKQLKWGDIDGNIISYNYTAQFSEFHLVKALQINKGKRKGVCGYFMLFKHQTK